MITNRGAMDGRNKSTAVRRAFCLDRGQRFGGRKFRAPRAVKRFEHRFSQIKGTDFHRQTTDRATRHAIFSDVARGTSRMRDGNPGSA
jgi:hypothetical protein